MSNLYFTVNNVISTLNMLYLVLSLIFVYELHKFFNKNIVMVVGKYFFHFLFSTSAESFLLSFFNSGWKNNSFVSLHSSLTRRCKCLMDYIRVKYVSCVTLNSHKTHMVHNNRLYVKDFGPHNMDRRF